MSGVATPPIVTQPFGADATAPYITLPIPVPSQIGVDPGKASFTDGFPPLNMTNPTLGGIPPSGADMNGVLYTVSAYAAFIRAGQWPAWDQDVSDAIAGYTVGAVVYDSTTNTYYTSAVDENTDDPVADGAAQWIRSVPLYATDAPATGTENNYALPGPSDYALDIDTTAGPVDFTGFVAQRDGQKLFLSNVGASLLQVLALNGGSAADNQIRAASNLAVIQNQTLTLMYSEGASKWLIV